MSGFSRNLVRVTLALLALATFHTSLAQEHDNAMTIQVEAQPLATALQDFSEQSGLQVAYVATLAQDVTSKGARDAATPVDALAQILDSTGLEYQFVNADTVAIGPAAAADKGGDSDPGNERTAGARQRPVMMAQAVAEQSQTGRRTETDSDEDEKKRPIEEIIVTGTNIRGIALESSPVKVFTREDIQITGAATAQDFIQTLPFNFGGGSNSDIPGSLPGDGAAGGNNISLGALGSSVNLRGLGSGATLVLLNGHRVAPSSGNGDFTDISMIPASAIERIEVLNDGASSIYGGDAIAGVVNFILRDDYEGVETSFRYGIGTQHQSPEEFRASATAGVNWDSGNALVVYEYFNQDQISAEDRSFSQGALLTNYLQPSQERHSVLASLSQDFGNNFETYADLTYATRDAVHKFTRNPNETSVSMPSWDTLSIFAGGTWRVSSAWFVDISGTHSVTQGVTPVRGVLPFVRDPAIRDTDSNLWTADLKASGTIFDLPGGELKLAVGGHYREENFVQIDVTDDNRIDREADRQAYAVFAEAHIPFIGPDNRLPGIERLEVNMSGRLDDYSDFGNTVNPKFGVLWSPVTSLNLRGSYSTSFNPPPLGRVGARDLGVTIFRTSFLNNLFGFTPGDPSIADVVSMNVSGTARNLEAEDSKAFTAGLDYSEDWGRHTLELSISHFDIEFANRLGRAPVPENRSGLDAPNIAFNNPDAFPTGTVVFSPSQDEIASVIDNALRVSLVGVDADDIPNTEIINFANVTRNLSRTVTSGFDFDVAYTYESTIGNLQLGIDATILNEFKQQAADSTPLTEQVNTLYNPIDLRLRGRAGFVREGLSANMFVNYSDNYSVNTTADAMGIDSWTTVDVSFSYNTERKFGNPIINDTVFRLSVVNLFDEDPASISSAIDPISLIFGYDPANASPLGRFIAFELTKRF